MSDSELFQSVGRAVVEKKNATSKLAEVTAKIEEIGKQLEALGAAIRNPGRHDVYSMTGLLIFAHGVSIDGIRELLREREQAETTIEKAVKALKDLGYE